MRMPELQNPGKILSCGIEENKELAPLSTLGVGGRCEFFAEPSDLDGAVLIFKAIFKARMREDFPLYIIGGGSNVVFADGTLPGLVLSSRRLNRFRWTYDNGRATLDAEAGYPLPSLVADSVSEGLTGAEFAIGIPGTLGGAMAGNAGAGGLGVCDLLEEVTSVEDSGEIRVWKRGEFTHSYRYFSLASSARFLAGCKMTLHRAARSEVERALGSFRQKRLNQPKLRSAGSTFKNPPGGSAGRLLEISGCKGLRIGGAVVSDVHANFIVNAENAKGKDVFELMMSCRDIVLRKTGITLESEIKFLGF